MENKSLNNNRPIILTSEEFFDTMKFQELSPEEKVSYILFFVTQVAHLRNNMIPRIIADRINDQIGYFFQRNKAYNQVNYIPITPQEVKQILENNNEWFVQSDIVVNHTDRNPYMIEKPYSLTEKRKEELWAKFDKDIRNKISYINTKFWIDKFSSFILFLIVFFISLFLLINLLH